MHPLGIDFRPKSWLKQIGLLGPILLKSKLLMRELCVYGLSWKDVILDKLRQNLVAITIDRKELCEIRFSRSVVPEFLLVTCYW